MSLSRPYSEPRPSLIPSLSRQWQTLSRPYPSLITSLSRPFSQAYPDLIRYISSQPYPDLVPNSNQPNLLLIQNFTSSIYSVTHNHLRVIIKDWTINIWYVSKMTWMTLFLSKFDHSFFSFSRQWFYRIFKIYFISYKKLHIFKI